MGLGDEVTPRRSLAVSRGSSTPGTAPLCGTLGKRYVVFAFLMQIQIISPSAQQPETAVQCPKAKPLEATPLEYFIKYYTPVCFLAHVCTLFVCPTHCMLQKYFLFPGNPGNH